ncbi:MAG: phosphoserine phosphatase SerB [Pseudomonadota bacterium]
MVIARLIAEMPDWETRHDAARASLLREGAQVLSAEQLKSDPSVIEMRIEGHDRAAVQGAVSEHFAGSDMLVSDGEIALPRVFVSDMDSTMIGQECIDELADYAGIKPQIAAITERAMQGELDFENALRERVALLKGLPETAIAQCLAERIRPNPGAQTLVRTLRSKGCTTVLVTGGFHHFADELGARLGFDRVVGNRLSVADGTLTGALEGRIVDSNVKRAELMSQIPKGSGPVASCAIGDGANDIPMIEEATYGFAYCAKPKARAAANGEINQPDLTAVLTLLGVARSDWKAA